MRDSGLKTPCWLNLPQKIPGWENFIGSWLVLDGPTLLVDVGPSASVEYLAEQLSRMGITAIDYVFLTHIHIDHAGGLGTFLRRYPQAKAVVPAKAIPHLVDPTRLWEGSLKTLGDKALAYGPIEPVPADRLLPDNAFSLEGLTILETPGHAPFHVSFVYDDLLFCGESAGIFIPFGDDFYLRPPTPPRFFFETTLASVEKMLALENRAIFYGHGGSHPESRRMLKAYREQLFLWKEVIAQSLAERSDASPEEVIERLLLKDPFLRCFPKMDPSVQERERYFMGNSIAGFVGYLQSRNSPSP